MPLDLFTTVGPKPTNMIFLTATHGEGEPPEKTVDFYTWLQNGENKNFAHI